MHRYFVQLRFKGTAYHGWQIQPNARSVQEVLERALSTLLREEISVVGAGRTDTGVHASFFILHFETGHEIANPENLTAKMNRFLPADIALQKIWEVNQDLHARFSATARTYHYYICTQKDPFQTDIAWYYYGPLNLEKMNQAAGVLLEYEDFTSFSRLHTDVKTNRCKIYQAEWIREENRIVFRIKADRFLRNMVRAIVGTLMEVGRGKLAVESVREIIEKKDRGAAGASAPAHGLFLVDIEYPE